MKQITINRKLAITLGALLALPASYFILSSLLKYGFGISFLFDTAQPLMERLGSNEALGWNINLLILLGPLVAMVLNLISVFKIEWYNEKHNFSIKISIEKHWWNMVLVLVSGILLATLFIYALGENCGCC